MKLKLFITALTTAGILLTSFKGAGTVAAFQTQDLLNRLPLFSAYWNFNYKNHQRLDITNEPFLVKYYENMFSRPPRTWALGRFCTENGTTKILVYEERTAPVTQYDFKLLNLNNTGITGTESLFFTRVVAGKTEVLTDISVRKIGSKYKITRSTIAYANGRKSSETFVAPANCK